jgi:glycosyltransferase involved in cell wall biosynthesis
MKILHLANVIGDYKAGGVHEVVSNFYKNQKLLKHEPHIWYPGSDDDANSIRLDNNIKGLPTFGDSKYGLVKGLFQKIPKEIESFDIIHQHGIWMPISIYNKKIRENSNLKSVIQPHGYLESFRLNISKYKKKIAFNLFEKSNLEGASVLVACAEDEGVNLKNIFPTKDIAVIHNGISNEFFNEPSLKYKVKKKKKRMLFLSQIIPIKGLERLFEVISDLGIYKFEEWEFLIAGYEYKKYTNILKKLVNKLNLNAFVSFVGPKLRKDKIEIIDNTDVFILPTYNENYGIVIAEALARGIPVITTKGTPWEELNTKGCGFWVDNTNEGIKSGLLNMLGKSEKELQVMGARGRKLIESKYLWDNNTKRTIELYNWVLNGGQKPNFII